jgi:2-amino-4-hydroxy-6-hydroxymethyldihydropteridine diphosphokinase
VNRAFISLGSNIDSEHNMKEAVRRLGTQCPVLAVSTVYETAPVGNTQQPRFLNAAVLVETELTATQLKEKVLLVIEQELGRVRTEDKNAPRTIDLDIAAFAPEAHDEGLLTFHDSDILRYAHVAMPLADIAPSVRHPATGQTLHEIAEGLATTGLVYRPEIVLWP